MALVAEMMNAVETRIQNLTARQRADLRAHFIRAKSVLAKDLSDMRFGQKKFICDALYLSAGTSDMFAKEIVMSRLCDRSTLEGWLRERLCIDSETLRYSADRVQATRHAWIDSLIEEFS